MKNLIFTLSLLISARIALGEDCVNLWDADYKQIPNSVICPGKNKLAKLFHFSFIYFS